MLTECAGAGAGAGLDTRQQMETHTDYETLRPGSLSPVTRVPCPPAAQNHHFSFSLSCLVLWEICVGRQTTDRIIQPLYIYMVMVYIISTKLIYNLKYDSRDYFQSERFVQLQFLYRLGLD